MATIPEFETELKLIDPRLSIVQNPNRPNICNIKLSGTDICPIPSGEIRDDSDPSYAIEMPNGMMIPHRSRNEAIAMVKHTLNLISTKDGHDAFFGLNGY
jgi:hypothetical protein